MHELSVAEALLALAIEHGERAHARHISDVYIVVGQLSSVVDESVQLYWDMISAGTLAARARLHFRPVPARLACQDCGRQYAPAADELGCPACGSLHVKIVAGEELYLEAIDVVADDEAPSAVPNAPAPMEERKACPAVSKL